MESAESDNIKKRKEKLIICLEKCLSVITHACKKARISRDTYHRWYNEDAEFKAKADEIKEASIDFAESKLFELITGAVVPEDKIFNNDGKPLIVKGKRRYPPDTAAVIFFLKTKGKQRGYVEKQEIEHSGVIKQDPEIDLSKYTDEELRTLIELQSKGRVSQT